MTDRATKYLRDALNEAKFLAQDLGGHEEGDLETSRQLLRVTERSLEIIGESIRRALDADESLAAAHPELRRWVALRNVVIHQYDDLRPETLWAAATSGIEDLQELLIAITD